VKTRSSTRHQNISLVRRRFVRGLSILLLILGVIVLVIVLAFAFWLIDENRRLNAGSQVIATSLGTRF
jgi:uncharacterized membrane protein YqjE